MSTPKPPRGLSRQKQMLKHAKSRRLSVLEAAQMRSLGRKDGSRSLPRIDESGIWLSPLLRRETDAYSEFCAFAWGSLQTKLEFSHKEIERLCRDIDRLEAHLNLRRKNMPPLDLSVRLRGEEGLANHITRTRRQKEYERRHGEYLNELRRAEDALSENYQQLAEHQSIVQSAEQMTRMVCERVYGNTKQRCDAYWDGALSTHLQADSLPPAPNILPESDAESVYLSQHETTEIAAGKMLAHNNRVAFGNRNRSEERV